jgi:hypothetical protein
MQKEMTASLSLAGVAYQQHRKVNKEKIKR